jgi:hypothetical protein
LRFWGECYPPNEPSFALRASSFVKTSVDPGLRHTGAGKSRHRRVTLLRCATKGRPRAALRRAGPPLRDEGQAPRCATKGRPRAALRRAGPALRYEGQAPRCATKGRPRAALRRAGPALRKILESSPTVVPTPCLRHAGAGKLESRTGEPRYALNQKRFRATQGRQLSSGKTLNSPKNAAGKPSTQTAGKRRGGLTYFRLPIGDFRFNRRLRNIGLTRGKSVQKSKCKVQNCGIPKGWILIPSTLLRT